MTDEYSLNRKEKSFQWAKAQIIKIINCPDLKVGAIEKQTVTGL